MKDWFFSLNKFLVSKDEWIGEFLKYWFCRYDDWIIEILVMIFNIGERILNIKV